MRKVTWLSCVIKKPQIENKYFSDDSDSKMRVDYSDDLDGPGKLQSGKRNRLDYSR